MQSNKIQVLRGHILQHGKHLDHLPAGNTAIQLTPLGSGGCMLSQTATRALVSLFRAEDDLVVIDRGWMRGQLLTLGIEGNQADLLLDNIGAPIRRDTPDLTFLGSAKH